MGFLATLSVALAGCSSGGEHDTTTSTTTKAHTGPAVTVPPSATIGLGATTDVWDAHHKAVSGGYGPEVVTADGTKPRYSDVSKDSGRIAGWNMAFARGSLLSTGVVAVRAQLPTDAQQTAAWAAGGKPGTSSSCEVFEYHSDMIHKVLSSRFAKGSFAVVFTGLGLSTKPAHSGFTVGEAKVGVAPSTQSSTCPS